MNTAVTPAVKTIDVNAKEWFDKVNCNSYFSARVTVNQGMQDEHTFILPFQYGYDEQYKHKAKEVLIEMGLIPNVSFYELREIGVIVRSHKESKCKKAEVKAFGQRQIIF